jgi:hypothetical protein
MTATFAEWARAASGGSLAPYILLIVVGFLPTEIWRMLGIVLARGIDEDSDIILVARAVATAILTGVVGKLVIFAPGALAGVPLMVRIGAATLGLAAFAVFRRSVFAGVAVSTAAILAAMLMLAD